MCCFPQRCKLLFRAVFLRFDLSLVVTSQHEKIVVFQHSSVNSEDFFPLLLESIKFNKAFSKIDIVGSLKNKRIVLLWQKACHPKWQKKNVFYAFITWQITPLQLYISVLIYTVQLYYYCFLLFIEIKKK